MSGRALRALTGVAAVAAMVAVIVLAATLFRGGLTDSVPVTVMSPRAGLVIDFATNNELARSFKATRLAATRHFLTQG